MTDINNRYQLLDQLGEGGMGRVYLVQDQVLDNRELALKTLRREKMSSSRLRSFQDEFRILSSFSHPHIEEVYDYGEIHDGPEEDLNQFFFTSKYYEGSEIDNVLDEDDWEQLYGYIVQICRGLQFLHSRGLVHYDVKPGNLLVTQEHESKVKLIDFGLASRKKTEEGESISGTVPYIAPEVIQRDSVDGRVDLYSLGVTLHELVLGERPFQGNNTDEIFRKHLNASPPISKETNENIPQGLQDLISQLLRKDPEQRLSSASTVIQLVSDLAEEDYESEVQETLQGYISSQEFVGREVELEQLKDFWRRIDEGESISDDGIEEGAMDEEQTPHFLLVSGEAGIGKTRLIEEFRIWAQIRSIPCFRSRGDDQTREGFAVFRTFLESLIRRVEVAGKEDGGSGKRLTEKYAPYLATIVPEIEQRYDPEEPPELEDEDAEKTRLLDQISNYILASVSLLKKRIPQEDEDNESDSGAILILEDLHGADEMSLELLEILARKSSLDPGTHSLMILGSRRTEETNERLSDMTGSLRREGYLTERTLGPLSPDEAVQYVVGICGRSGEQLAKVITDRESSGNPFFIQEIMRTCVEEGILSRDGVRWKLDEETLGEMEVPDSLQTLIDRRVSRLNPNEHRMLEALSVWGVPIPKIWLKELIGEDRVLSNEAISRLIDQGILREEKSDRGKQLRITHDQFIRFYQRKLKEENRWKSVHGSLLKRLERWCNRGEQRTTEYIEQLARFSLESDNLERFRTYGFDAVQYAEQQYAYERAIRYLENLLKTDLSEGKEEKTREKLGDVFSSTGNLEAARDQYRLIVEKHPTYPAAVRRIRKLAEVTKILGDVKRAESLFQRVIDHFEGERGEMERGQQASEEQSTEEIQVLFEVAKMEGERGKFQKARNVLDRAEQKIKREVRDPDRTRELYNVMIRYSGLFHFRQEQYEQAKIRFQENATYYRNQNNRQKLAKTYGYLGMVHGDMGQLQEALFFHRKSLSISKEIGNKRGLVTANGNLGVLYWSKGDLDRSRSYHRQFLALSEEIGSRRKIALAKGWIGLIHTDRGELERALSYFEEELSINEEIGDQRRVGLACDNLASVYRDMGELNKAMNRLQQYLSISKELDYTPGIQGGNHEISVLHRIKGEYKEALKYQSIAREVLSDSEDVKRVAESLIERARIRRHQGKLDQAKSRIDQALDLVREPEFYRPPVEARMEKVRILRRRNELNLLRERMNALIRKDLEVDRKHILQVDVRLLLVETFQSTELEPTELEGAIRIEPMLKEISERLEHTKNYRRRVRLEHCQKLNEKKESPEQVDGQRITALHERLREEEHVSLADELEHLYQSYTNVEQAMKQNGAKKIEPRDQQPPEENIGEETDRERERYPETRQQERLEDRIQESSMAHLVRSRRNQEAIGILSTVIQSDLTPDRMLDVIIESIVDFMRAQRGFVFLSKDEITEEIDVEGGEEAPDPGENTGFVPVSSSIRTEGEDSDSDLEKTAREIADLSLVREVAETGKGRMGADASEDEQFTSFSTIHQLNLKSVLLAPIPGTSRESVSSARSETTGVIYLDDPITPAKFSREDLELLTAVCRELAGPLSRALEQERNRKRLKEVREKYRRAKQELRTRYSYDNIVGKSAPMQNVYEVLDKVSDTEMNVVIEGETGTGKELVARAIHYNGPRRDEPFLAVNCARFSEELLESELFGHEKGAFTGASEQRKGLFEQADQGTLFLDEIGEMSPSMQSRLLRVLETENVRRVGGETSIQVDVRIVCATNRNLKEEIQDGSFREDLYYRLAHATMELPALEERREDIPLLVDHFLEEIVEEPEAPKPECSEELMEHLMKRDWPGNVRELRSVVRQCYLFAEDRRNIGLDVLKENRIREVEADDETQKAEGEQDEDGKVNPAMPLDELEKRAILEALRETDGQKTKAADILDIHRNTLRRKINKYELQDQIP